MSAHFLHLPAEHLIAAEMRLARRATLPSDNGALPFANWLLGHVSAGRISIEMAEAICRYQENVA
ncbi:MAG: hypothetical protein SFW64_00070 [Alphaproteobacteria bacterium]|nr:hypothetical protein [Alphaproteobacteria bacterium]